MNIDSYPLTKKEHWVMLVELNGQKIRLDDESCWEVSPDDTFTSMLWLPATNVSIEQSSDVHYPYTLQNLDNSEKVLARLL